MEYERTIATVVLSNGKCIYATSIEVTVAGVYLSAYEEADYGEADVLTKYFYPMSKVKHIKYE